MITTVLAIFTLAAALGEAPHQIISAHKTYAECQNAKQKLLHEKWQEMQSGPNAEGSSAGRRPSGGVASLQKNTTFPACLRVVFEDAKTNGGSDVPVGAHINEEDKKG